MKLKLSWIVVSIFVIFVLITIIVSIYSIFIIQTSIDDDKQRRDVEKLDIIARSFENALTVVDYAEAQAIAKRFFTELDVNSIQIYNSYGEAVVFLTKDANYFNTTYVAKKIIKSRFNDQPIGSVSVQFFDSKIKELLNVYFIRLGIIYLISQTVIFILIFGSTRIIKRIFNSLVDGFKMLESAIPITEFKFISIISDFDFVFNRFIETGKKLDEYRNKEKEFARNQGIMSVASQVSHDIRSPLSALNVIVGQLVHVPENQRIIIRSSVNRINDIANQLLIKGKQINSSQGSNPSSNENEATTLRIELLSPIIDNLISEKRIQFREKQETEIDANVTTGYGLFTNINAIEFKRVLSNITNNSIEAFPNGKGKFTISIKSVGDSVIVLAQDNGKGIPEHIMKELGKIGVTHGKEGTSSGSGLGVYHAKKAIESFGGKFDIISQEGVGTTITMIFPRARPPKWFVEKLVFKQNMQVISLDDDLSIHQIWKGRFLSQKLENINVEHLTFTSGSEFKTWVISQKHKSPQLYLVDYELLNQDVTGLDLIEELGISSQAILITSRYEENNIRERCEKLGVRLIPKTMAGFVPIEIEKPKIYFDAILLDDDELIHQVWNLAAKGKNKKLDRFYRPDDFFKRADELDLNSPLYIDSNLGNGVKGEEVAKIASDIGFKNIYLCTGYDPDNFPKMNWIKKIVPKDPPF